MWNECLFMAGKPGMEKTEDATGTEENNYSGEERTRIFVTGVIMGLEESFAGKQMSTLLPCNACMTRDPVYMERCVNIVNRRKTRT